MIHRAPAHVAKDVSWIEAVTGNHGRVFGVGSMVLAGLEMAISHQALFGPSLLSGTGPELDGRVTEPGGNTTKGHPRVPQSVYFPS